MNCLLVGDSHLSSLKQALTQAGKGPEAARFAGFEVRALGRGYLMREAFFVDRGDYAEIVDPEFRARVERVPPAEPSFDWIGISGPLNTAVVWRDPAFAHFRPFPLVGGTSVSVATLRAAVEANARRSIEFTRVVARKSRVFVIEAPWPFRAHRAVRTNGAETVKFVHRWYREYVLRELDRHGIPVLAVGQECADEDGFTRDVYHSEKPADRYHANAAFGRVALDRIVARFGGVRTA